MLKSRLFRISEGNGKCQHFPLDVNFILLPKSKGNRKQCIINEISVEVQHIQCTLSKSRWTEVASSACAEFRGICSENNYQYYDIVSLFV